MEGFEAGDKALPTPVVDVSDDVRARLVTTLYAIVDGRTPEEIAGYLESGFPQEIDDALNRPGERDEMAAHVALMLSVIQAPVSQEV